MTSKMIKMKKVGSFLNKAIADEMLHSVGMVLAHHAKLVKAAAMKLIVSA